MTNAVEPSANVASVLVQAALLKFILVIIEIESE